MVTERWKIYWANLDPAQGSEQAGRRPVLVISADEVNVLHQVTILPFTSVKDAGRKIRCNEVAFSPMETGLGKDSILLAHQIRTVDKSRLESVAGKITDPTKKAAIIAALKVQLGL